jgi:hypothetical protein
MAELLDILDAFATPLKVGWVVWLAWGIGLVFWYRHDRSSEIAAQRPSPPVRKPFVSRPSRAPRTATRLITAEPVVGHKPPVSPQPEAPPPVAPLLLEPAGAPLEDPDPGIDHVAELDRFVADFEMNTRHRHGTAPNEEQSSFNGRTL